MTTKEFSDGFDTLVSSYRRFKDFDKKEELDSIEFDEYEKSLFLTAAQEDIVVGYYSGKNTSGESFELTEEMRRYLDSLVKMHHYTNLDAVLSTDKLSPNSLVFSLPDDLAFIVLERIKLSGSDVSCVQGDSINVYPVTHDEYNKIIRNPFRGPSRYKAIRIDKGSHQVEIISKYAFDHYDIRYLAKPTPIVLENLPDGVSVDGVSTKTECSLNSMLHETILRQAVKMALGTKGIYANT